MTKSGVVAPITAASPLAVSRWPRNTNRNGTTLENSVKTEKACQARPNGGRRTPCSVARRVRNDAAMTRREAVMVSTGNSVTMILLNV